MPQQHLQIPDFQPAEQGYSMPAEWERHDATWLAWPHHEPDWPGKFGPVPWIYADIVRHIASAERVHLLVQSTEALRNARNTLKQSAAALPRITFHVQPTDRIWTRDSGPIFVRSNSRKPQLAAVGWQFNGWAKYRNYRNDEHLPGLAAEVLKIPLCRPVAPDSRGRLKRLVLEGGSIDVNGQGCLLTTEECLLSRIQQRNPGFTQSQIEAFLCHYLGVRKILWLHRGIAGDDTHGHVDDTARFAAPGLILTCTEANKRDANHAPLRENLRRLKTMRDPSGRQFTIAELPMPRPVIFRGQRLPASYANFYICNAGVLVPAFNDAADVTALKVIEQAFAPRPIIPIYCRDLVWGLGTIHCMTQQQPALQGKPKSQPSSKAAN